MLQRVRVSGDGLYGYDVSSPDIMSNRGDAYGGDKAYQKLLARKKKKAARSLMKDEP